MTKSFTDSDGNLKELAKTLIAAEESWTLERTKLKRPAEWIVSALRLSGAQWAIGRVLGSHGLLGEPLWRPPGPNGFADDESAWIDGLSQRVDIADDRYVMIRIIALPGEDPLPEDVIKGPKAPAAEETATLTSAGQ